MAKKMGLCWAKNCNEPAVASIKMKIQNPKIFGSLEHTACLKHFKIEWKRVTKPMIERFLKDQTSL